MFSRLKSETGEKYYYFLIGKRIGSIGKQREMQNTVSSLDPLTTQKWYFQKLTYQNLLLPHTSLFHLHIISNRWFTDSIIYVYERIPPKHIIPSKRPSPVYLRSDIYRTNHRSSSSDFIPIHKSYPSFKSNSKFLFYIPQFKLSYMGHTSLFSHAYTLGNV